MLNYVNLRANSKHISQVTLKKKCLRMSSFNSLATLNSILQKLSPLACLRRIREDGISEAFPNVDTAFRVYLTLPVANTEGERSFSVFKRVKNQLRSTISQDKL